MYEISHFCYLFGKMLIVKLEQKGIRRLRCQNIAYHVLFSSESIEYISEMVDKVIDDVIF